MNVFKENTPESDHKIREQWVYSKTRCYELDKNFGQLVEDLNNYRFNYNKTLEESHKKQESVINLLKTKKNNLIKTINQNKTDIENMSKQLEELKDNVKTKDSEIDKYKDKYEDMKSQNQKNEKFRANCEELTTQNQTLKEEIQTLRQDRKRLEYNNNYYKQKVLSVSHTAITQHQLYANSVRKVAINDINVANELCEELVDKFNDILKDLPKSFKRKITEGLAKTVANVDENMQQIHKKQRKMEKKTVDGKVQCGSCEKTFFRCVNLKNHMIFAHNMNTTDLSKNKPQIIEID